MKLNRQPVEISSERAVSNPPGTVIDAIEYCRGYLAAMAYVSPTAAREVHIQRLRQSFLRAGMVQKLRYSLWALELMREVQEVGGGYWFPTPLRIVPFDRQAILVGPTPTRELQRHFCGVARAGYARVLAHLDARGLPVQELDDWLGLHVNESVAWSATQIANARSVMGPTISSGNVQFFSVGAERSHAACTKNPVWTNDPRNTLIEQGVVLCRERVAPERYRYFFGRLEGARLTAESPISKDLARLQFGFAALAGKPFTVVVKSRGIESVIHVPANLPRPERQLTLALGVRDLSFSRKAYRVYVAFLDVLTKAGLQFFDGDDRHALQRDVHDYRRYHLGDIAGAIQEGFTPPPRFTALLLRQLGSPFYSVNALTLAYLCPRQKELRAIMDGYTSVDKNTVLSGLNPN